MRKESEKRQVQALVYVGDAMEEPIDDLCAAAGELGLLGVRAFMFQEGGDPVAENAYREIARLSRGAYGRFAPGAAQELAELLRAAAAYAAGGMKALTDLSARRSRRRAEAAAADELTGELTHGPDHHRRRGAAHCALGDVRLCAHRSEDRWRRCCARAAASRRSRARCS